MRGVGFAWGGVSEICKDFSYVPQSLGNIEISANDLQPIRFQGQFFDVESGLHYNRFRYYDNDCGMFVSRDPIGLMGGSNVFAYAYNNPIKYIDPNGKVPVKNQVGTLEEFVTLINTSPSKVGTLTGTRAKQRLIQWGEFDILSMAPADAWLNTQDPRYIYTKKGGWIDMQHFMYYAGKAYKYKISQCVSPTIYPYIYPCYKNPIGEAMQDGYQQERFYDQNFAQHSAYTYEDLPSDRYGAIFGGQYFDPKSKLTLSEQISGYIKTLEPADPSEAPNFNKLPKTDDEYVKMHNEWRKKGMVTVNTMHGSFTYFDENKAGPRPVATNKTTKPMYTKE